MKLIKLSEDHYIVVDDSEIKEGWKGWAYKHDVKGKIFEHVYTTNSWYKDARKVTHSTQPLEILKGKGTLAGVTYPSKGHPVFDVINPLTLSEVEELTLGYSVEKMAFQLFGGSFEARGVESEEEADKIIAFGVECINAHKELVKDKLFTVENMKNAISFGVNTQHTTLTPYGIDVEGDKFIQSLLPKTEWDIDVIDGKIVLL